MASVLQLILKTSKQGTGVKDTKKELGGLEKAAKSAALAFVAMGAAKVIKNATLLAARVETLGIVTKQLGSSQGMTEQQVRSLERSIVDQGITLQGSRQAFAMMIQSNVDLADATDLARLAQDTAVIANVNSSEAFKQLTYVLQTGNVRMARTLGLNVQFGKAQQELAKTLGKTTAELTEQEIMQSRTNAVMKAGERIAGTYTAAMGTSGKQLLSMDRQIEELSRIIGEGFLPALEKVVGAIYEAANALTTTISIQKYYDEAVRFYSTLLLVTDAEYKLTAEYLKQRDVLPELVGSLEGLTEAELLQKAVEALLAGDVETAQHFADLAHEAEAGELKTRALIAALDELDGKKISAEILLKAGIGAGATFESYSETSGAGFQADDSGGTTNTFFEEDDGTGMMRAGGGPVEEGKPYIVGEGGSELFVPRQDGDIYNQQQLAGGDININSGVSQRAFNNMAEDWMRGLGG